jgi:dolichyl-phosphate beta-glucosyltransferase
LLVYLISQSIIDSQLKLAASKNITCISYSLNQGKSYAVKTGVEYANSDEICYIDSDLAYSLDNLKFMVEELKHLDIVVGCRNLNIEIGCNDKLGKYE